MKKIEIGFLGCGNIGGGVWRMLHDMRGEIESRDGLSIRAVNGQSPCLDAATLPALGVRAAVRQWGRLNDPQMLKDTAAAWLAAHDRPQTGCEAEVLCRWEESGDPADLPAAGGRCRIHTDSGVLQGRITKLSWTDLREDPRRLRLSIALDAG